MKEGLPVVSTNSSRPFDTQNTRTGINIVPVNKNVATVIEGQHDNQLPCAWRFHNFINNLQQQTLEEQRKLTIWHSLLNFIVG